MYRYEKIGGRFKERVFFLHSILHYNPKQIPIEVIANEDWKKRVAIVEKEWRKF
jgi:hypothetical protein